MRSRKDSILIVLVLLAFTALGVLRHLHAMGEDLASSYVGCRLLATGEGAHLYSRSSRVFTDVDDPVWDQVALRTGFTALNLLHPYVQTPLWAWSLQPVCTRVSFQGFCLLFEILLMLCSAGTLWLVARYWTPVLFHPGWVALVCTVLYVSQPFQYALFLAQTQLLILFLSVAALVLAERGRYVAGGVLLAVATLIKITPGFLLLYWLVTRRWKAAATFAVALGALLLLGTALPGVPVMRAYLRSLSANSNVLLVAFNNQSLAAWWMAFRIPRIEAYRWDIFALPPVLKSLGLALSVVGSLAGGLLDRDRPTWREAQQDRPPYGAVLAMLAATIFTSIAWLHYYVLLIIPAMVLIQTYRQDHRRAWLGLLLVTMALNLYPISFGAVGLRHRRISIVRSEFYAGVLMMGAMIALSRTRRHTPPQGVSLKVNSPQRI